MYDLKGPSRVNLFSSGNRKLSCFEQGPNHAMKGNGGHGPRPLQRGQQAREDICLTRRYARFL
jgi:hypothetical protein